MNNYVVRIISFQPKTVEVIKEILDSPVISRLVFPASIPEEPLLKSSTEFDFARVPSDFKAETLVRVPLYSENGVEFVATIYTVEKPAAPHVINLYFSTAHLESQFITYAILKSLILEVAEIFQTDLATIYDASILEYRKELLYFKAPGWTYYPLELGWISFFGPRLLSFLGEERFLNIKTCFEKMPLQKGYWVSLQEEPYQAENPVHREREVKAMCELELQKLL